MLSDSDGAIWSTYPEAAALCIRRRTLRRTVPIALTVGVLLTAINLGGVFLSGRITMSAWIRVVFNFLVPFVVSTLGFLSATRDPLGAPEIARPHPAPHLPLPRTRRLRVTRHIVSPLTIWAGSRGQSRCAGRRFEEEKMAEITVYGADWCPDCRRSKRFLAEQRIPYGWVDVDATPGAKQHVERLNGGAAIIPTIVFPDGSHLAEPTNEQLAEKLGLRRRARHDRYDLVVVGGGPTGLSAAIYAARENLRTLVIERSAIGGQAGVTERIDNYPGFPDGIGGAELAGLMEAHAERYEVDLLSAVGVAGLSRERGELAVSTTRGDRYVGGAVLIATGSSYRRLGVPGEEGLIGAGIHFCATCDGPFYRGARELLVIGGGNSGVEEGLFLAQFAERIRLVEFLPELGASARLRDAVRSDPRFTIHTNTEVVGFLRGPSGKLAKVRARDRATGEDLEFRPAAAFEFIGLDPNTAFLRGALDLDSRGFIATAGGHQTSLPGVFAAGDVRAGSTKQLAAAVGDGVSALLEIRRYVEGRSSGQHAVAGCWTGSGPSAASRSTA